MRSNRIRQPRVEALLQRALLSVSVVKETLTIEGTAGRDEIVLGVHPQVINLMSVKINGDEKVFLLGSFKVINVRAYGGADTVRVSDLYGGAPDFFTIDLGAGDDRFYGSTGHETIIGGNGDDRIIAGGGNDSINAGAGNDIVLGESGQDCIAGVDGDDTLYGGTGGDSVYGGNGADSIDGGLDSDSVDAGSGNDRITERHDRDSYSSYEVNRILGGSGDDYIDLGSYDYQSSVWGGDGQDYLIGDNAVDKFHAPALYGEAGDDKIIGRTMYGGDGADRLIISTESNVSIDGGNGSDFIELRGNGSGSVAGGADADTIHSYSEAATVNGDGGNDQLTAAYRINGGDGDDLLRPAYGNLKGARLLTGVTLRGGAGDDTLHGSPASDELHGEAGDDILHGENASDTLWGGDDNDLLFGGNDVDELHGGEGDDALFAGGYKDRNRADDGKDMAYGEGGHDLFDRDSSWARTDSTRDDGTAVMASNGTLSLASGSGANFDDLLQLAQNYGSSLTVWNGGSYGSSASVTFDDLLQLGQNYGGVIQTPGQPSTPVTPVVGDPKLALSFFKDAAILSGTLQSASNSIVSPRAGVIPQLTAGERKSIRGQFVHLPSDWELVREGKGQGLVWYHVLTKDSFGRADNPDIRASLQRHFAAGETRRAGTSESRLVVQIIGMHPTTVVLHDGSPANVDEPWTWRDPIRFDIVQRLVTKTSLIARLAGSGETMTFVQPAVALLDTVQLESGVRYLYTRQGLRTYSDTGVGELVS